MNYILDTHALIWALTDTGKLSGRVKKIIAEDDASLIYVSTISLWEISIKYGLKKIDLQGFSPQMIPALCEQSDYKILPVTAQLYATYHLLENYFHRDPFDRLLIWQALNGNHTLISKDEDIKQYKSIGLNVIW